jgi:hypothetical protein
MPSEFQQLGKWIIAVGGVIVLIGVIIFTLARWGPSGLFPLPGDIEYSGKNWRVYLPITSCIVLSLLLTLILWLIHHFRR